MGREIMNKILPGAKNRHFLVKWVLDQENKGIYQPSFSQKEKVNHNLVSDDNKSQQ